MADNIDSISGRIPPPSLETLVRRWEDAKLDAMNAYAQGLAPRPADAVFSDRMERVYEIERRIGAAPVASAGDLRAAVTFLDGLLTDFLDAKGSAVPRIVLESIGAFTHELDRRGGLAA